MYAAMRIVAGPMRCTPSGRPPRLRKWKTGPVGPDVEGAEVRALVKSAPPSGPLGRSPASPCLRERLEIRGRLFPASEGQGGLSTRDEGPSAPRRSSPPRGKADGRDAFRDSVGRHDTNDVGLASPEITASHCSLRSCPNP